MDNIDPFLDAAMLSALNAMLSGPSSSSQAREAWLRAIEADPVATAKIIDRRFCFAFATEDDARVLGQCLIRTYVSRAYDPTVGSLSISFPPPKHKQPESSYFGILASLEVVRYLLRTCDPTEARVEHYERQTYEPPTQVWVWKMN